MDKRRRRVAARLLEEYERLVRAHHPRMNKDDAQEITRKLAEITEQFAEALGPHGGEADADIGSLPEYRSFLDELRGLPDWFSEYVKQRTHEGTASKNSSS